MQELPWRTNGANAADNRTFMAVWDGVRWCLSGGTVAHNPINTTNKKEI